MFKCMWEGETRTQDSGSYGKNFIIQEIWLTHHKPDIGHFSMSFDSQTIK